MENHKTNQSNLQKDKLIEKACQIADDIFSELSLFIKADMTEVSIKEKILSLIETSEADGPSFQPIVASGKNAAHPHWEATDKILEQGDFVVIDMGVSYKEYASDMTRTISIGSPDQKHKQVYDVVLKALELGNEAMRPGTTAHEVDRVVRDYIKAEGFGEYFVHATGHGVDKDVHSTPVLRPNDETIIEEGMIITIEPGIYIPNELGCRIEDTILINKSENIILTKTTKVIIEV